MTVVCTVGYRTGLICDHKRNAGQGKTVCAIEATKVVCIYAGSPAGDDEE